MHLDFFIVFKIIHAYANSFVADRPDIEPLSFHTRRFYIPNFEDDNFQVFQTDFGADSL
jgi:hypothetical protein